MQHVCMKMMFIILFYLFYFCSILMHFNAACLHDSDVYFIFVLFIYLFCGISMHFSAACLHDNVYFIYFYFI